MSDSTWLKHLVLSHPTGFFPLNFNSDFPLSSLVVSIPPHMAKPLY